MSKLHRDNAGYIGCSYEETQDPYYSYNKLALPLSESNKTVIRGEQTFVVTQSNGKFVIDGVSQAPLTLVEGNVYTFDLSDSSVGSHPFRIKKNPVTSANSLTSGLPTGYSAITSSQYTGTVANIQTDDTNELYTTNNHIDFDLGSVKVIHNFIAKFRSNSDDSYSADYRIELHSGTAFDSTTLLAVSPTFESENTTDIKTIDHDFGGVSARYVRWAYTGGGRTSYLRYFHPYADTSDETLITSGTQGQSGATAKYVVPFGAGPLAYYCASHSGMGADIDTPTNASMFDGALPILKTTDRFGASVSGGSAVNVVGDPTSSTDNPFGTGNGHSVEFDGNDALRIQGGAIGTGNWTIEFWVKSGSYGLERIVSAKQDTYNNEKTNLRTWNGAWEFYVGDNPGHQYYSGTTISVNTWVHAAVCRNGTTIEYFANGSRIATDTIGASVTTTLTEVDVAHGYGSEYFTGKISNVRVSNTYRYSGSTYTIPTAGFTSDANTLLLAAHTSSITTVQGTWSSGAWPGTEDTAPDPYAANLVLAVPMNGSNGGTTFTDQSAAIKGSGSAKAISVNGNTQTSTAQSQYYDSCGYFDGSGDYLYHANNTDFDLAGGDFTIELWVYANSLGSSSYSSLVGKQSYSSNAGWALWIAGNASGNIGFFADINTQIVSAGGTFKPNKWTHVAATREKGFLRVFIDGKIVASNSSVTFSDVSKNLYIGEAQGSDSSWNNAYNFNGYIQDVRIYKGAAKYTSNFVVPNRIDLDDLSGNDNNASNVGATWQTSVQKFYGGAVQFSGGADENTANRIEVSDGLAFNTDFTVEFWAHATALTSSATLFDCWQGQSAGTGFYIWLNADGSISLVKDAATYYNSGFMSAGSLELKSWVHIALSRAGNTLVGYSNGSQKGSYTISDNWTSTKCYLGTGQGNSSMTGFEGYLQDFRIYSGIAKYTSSFSPPERSIQGTARRYPSGVYVVS